MKSTPDVLPTTDHNQTGAGELIPAEPIAGITQFANLSVVIDKGDFEDIALLAFDEQFSARMAELQAQERAARKLRDERAAEVLPLLEHDAGRRWKKTRELFRKVLAEVDAAEPEFALHVQVPERLAPDTDELRYVSAWTVRWRPDSSRHRQEVQFERPFPLPAAAVTRLRERDAAAAEAAAAHEEALQLKVDEQPARDRVARKARLTLTAHRVVSADGGQQVMDAIRQSLAGDAFVRRLAGGAASAAPAKARLR